MSYGRTGSFWYFQIDYVASNCTSIKGYTYYNNVYSYAVAAHAKYSNRSSITCYSYKDGDQCDVDVARYEHPGFLAGLIVSVLVLVGAGVVAFGMTCAYCEDREYDRRYRANVRDVNDLDAEL
jgi:hypothetical protein